MQIPPNYGAAYSDQFATIFKDVSQQTKAALIPFFFSAIHSNDSYFQADRLHPNESAQQALLDTVWPALWPLLQ